MTHRQQGTRRERKKYEKTHKCPLLIFQSLEEENAYAQLISVEYVYGVRGGKWLYRFRHDVFFDFWRLSAGAWGSEGGEDFRQISPS